MGGGTSKPKKVSADRVAGSADVLDILESNRPDDDAAASIAALRKIDANFKMNLMYHDEEGWGLLHVASSSRVGGERAACVDALVAHKCDVNAVASGTSRFVHTHNSASFAYEDSTPLMFCAQNGRVETMRALLQGQADVNMRSGDGGTALHVAAAHLQLQAARLLVDSGIDGTITSGVEEEAQPRRRKKKKKKTTVQDPDTEADQPDVDGADAEQTPPRPSPGAAGPAQYAAGLTAAQVAAATRDAAVLAQEQVEFSLEGFAICGQMKDEVDLAEEMYQLLSTISMKVPPKPEEELETVSAEQEDTDAESFTEDDDDDDYGSEEGASEQKEEEVGAASPAR